ncbi:MAG: hypothetical protein VW961_02400 [Flavobacteriaceae bacterium]
MSKSASLRIIERDLLRKVHTLITSTILSISPIKFKGNIID